MTFLMVVLLVLAVMFLLPLVLWCVLMLVGFVLVKLDEFGRR